MVGKPSGESNIAGALGFGRSSAMINKENTLLKQWLIDLSYSIISFYAMNAFTTMWLRMEFILSCYISHLCTFTMHETPMEV